MDKLNKGLNLLKAAFMNKQYDWWDEIDSAQQNAIDKALEEMKEGKLIPHEEVMANYDKWRKK